MRNTILSLCIVSLQFNSSAQQWDWAQSYETPNVHGSYFQAVTTDGLGSVISGGVVGDTVYFHTDTLWSDYGWDPTLNGDLVLVKHDIQTGEEIWVQRFGGRGFSRVNGLKCDAAGNIYVAAHYLDTLLMQGDTLLADGFNDGLLIKMDPDGQVIWYRELKTSWTGQVETMAISSSGTIIVSAIYSGAAWWDGVFLAYSGPGLHRPVIAGFNANGDLLWHHVYPASTITHVMAIETMDDKIWVSGWFQDEILLPPFSATASGVNDGFVARLDTLGNVDWLSTCGAPHSASAYAMVVDENMNVAVAGAFYPSMDWNGTFPEITTALSWAGDAFIARLDPQGNVIWTNRYSASFHSDALFSLSMDDVGDLYGSGYYRSGGPVTIANSVLPASEGGFASLLVVKVDPAGNDQWAVAVVPGYGQANGSAIDGEDLIVVGQTSHLTHFGNIIVPPGAFNSRPTVAKMDIGSGVPTRSVAIRDQIQATLAPNPSNGPITIQLEGAYTDLMVTVTDLTGRVIMQRNWIDTQRLEFMIEEAAGMYLVHLTSSTGEHAVWKVTRE